MNSIRLTWLHSRAPSVRVHVHVPAGPVNPSTPVHRTPEWRANPALIRPEPRNRGYRSGAERVGAAGDAEPRFTSSPWKFPVT